jgi:hypothetical protein
VARAPGSNLTQTLDAGLPDARYADVLADIEARVDAARVLALRAANAELMSVYWHVGRHIAEQEDAAPVKRGPNAPKVGEREFIIDLLFYHHPQRRFVVIELKVGEFDPEHAGKLNFYVSAVDEQLAADDDAPSIGILLCATRDEAVTEMTLRGISSPIAVARWKAGSEMTLTEEPAVSPGMRAELQEMREVEAELTAFATRQIAVIEDTAGPGQSAIDEPTGV